MIYTHMQAILSFAAEQKNEAALEKNLIVFWSKA